MNIILDLIWATVIGGLLLLAMVTSIMDVQAANNNLRYQISLAKITEDYIDTIDYFCSKVGAGVHPDSTVINTAIDTVFVFRAKEFSSEANPSTFSLSQGVSTTNGVPLQISKNGTVVFGPIWLAEPIDIDYFDSMGAMISTPVTGGDLDNIRGIRMELTPFLPGASRRGNARNVINRIVFWQSFVNVYL